MAHVALYREWRPLTFDEVVEQSHVVTALRHAVVTGQIAHAYLFSGTRGTGKTTVAKIFARAINCLSPKAGNPCNTCEICTGILNGSLLDVVEMDAASNNSVDTIRRIVDEVVFMPSQARFKVYIVDEVHMLSTGAFNALLKTLEEPPAHAVFILATTEPYRIPATILSRCQRYEFRRIPLQSLIGRLQEIATADGIAIEPEALDAIARLAEGGMRDAISLLDQVRMTAAPGQAVNRDDVLRMTGVADDELMARVSRAILTGQAPELLDAISQLVMTGRDPARFLIDLAAYCRNLLVAAVSPDPSELLQVTRDQLQRLQDISRLTDSATLVSLVRELSALHGELRWSSDSRTTLEIGLLRLMHTLPAPCAQPQAARPGGGSAGLGTPNGADGAGAGSSGRPSPRPAAGAAHATAGATAPITASATAPVTAGAPAPVAVSVQPAPPVIAPVAKPVPALPAEPAVVAFVPTGTMSNRKLDLQASIRLSAMDSLLQTAPPPSEPPLAELSPLDPEFDSPLPEMPAIETVDGPDDEPAYERPMPAISTAAASMVATAVQAAPIPTVAVPAVPVPAAAFAVAAVAASTAVAQAVVAEAPEAAPNAAQPADRSGDPFLRTPPAASSDPNDAARWQAIQDQLINDGLMTLYLFSRPAAFSFCGGELHLIFSEKDKVNYQELKEPQSIKALRSAATRIIGVETPVVVRLAEDPQAEAQRCPVPQEPAWITKVREAASAFGIPLKMEDH